MNDNEENWPAVGLNPVQHPPVPLAQSTHQKLRAIFTRHKKANKGPRQKFLRGLELALARHETSRTIEDTTGQADIGKELQKLQQATKNLREKHIERLSLTAQIMVGRTLNSSPPYEDTQSVSGNSLAKKALEIEDAVNSAIQEKSEYLPQLQYARRALVCDIGEALADLTEGGMRVTGDPNTQRADIHVKPGGILSDVYCVLIEQLDGVTPKAPKRIFGDGMKRLQNLRALERRVEEERNGGPSTGAILELRAIDRLKDALEADREN